jgi:DNA end-binding protein Ku
MKPTWSGMLSFGLVMVPVRLYAAVETRREIHYRLLDSATLTPIKEMRIDPKTGKEVPWQKIAYGVEVSKGNYVPLSRKELDALPLPSARSIELTGFVDRGDIDPLLFDRAYYLGAGSGGDKAYELIRRVLEEQEKAGIGKVALRMRDHLVAIVPHGQALVAHTLYYADEVRREDQVPDLPSNVKITTAEHTMAAQLITSMAMAFDPKAFKSDYAEALRRVVAAKAKGKMPEALPQPTAEVIDLQEALRQSLRARTGGTPKRAATGAGERSRGRRRAS